MLHLPQLLDPNDRRPWATWGIALLLILLFLPAQITARRRVHQGLSQLRRAIAFQAEHPGTHLDPRLRPFRPHAPVEDGAAASRSKRPKALRFQALEQVELDGITRTGFDTLAATAYWRWGVVPARFSSLRLFTYPLLHAGLLPLLCNLTFLLLCGPTLEADWGRRVHLGFLWLSAAIGGAVFALSDLSLYAALVGSSAAVAALVTAYLFRHGTRQLRPLALLRSPRWSALRLSGWSLVGLWVLRELATPLAPDLIALPGVGWASLWADAGGALFAAGLMAALRWGGLEERFLRRIAPRRDEQPDITRPLGPPPHGDSPPRDQGWERLLREAREDRANPEALAALWEAAVETGRIQEAAPLLLARIREVIHGADPIEAFEHWEQLGRHAPQAPLPLSLETRLAEALETAEHREQAQTVVHAAIARITPETAPATWARLLRMASDPDRARVSALAQRAAAGSPELRAVFEPPLPGPPPGTQAAPNARVPPVAPPGSGKGNAPIRPVSARPVALTDRVLTLELGSGVQRALHLQRVRAVAAAAIEGEGTGQNLVLDLLLEPPRPGTPPAKALRLESHGFDPRALVSSESDLEGAFTSLTETVLDVSGAAWLLGESPGDLRRYPSLSAYEEDLLKVLRLSVG